MPSSTDLAEAVRDAVAARGDEIVALLQALVRCRSENPKLLAGPAEQAAGLRGEAACQDLVGEALGELGMELDRWEVLDGREDLVGRLPGAGAGRSLILNGHVDVVPAGDPGEWPHDPWAGVVADGRVWGRGTCDMKAGLVSGIAALRVLRALGLRPAGDVLFQAVVDEETGGPGTRAALARGHVADGAIVLEPTGGAIEPVEGGLEWLRVVVRGHGGHSAARYRSVHAGGRGTAVSAIEKAAKLLAGIQELEREWGNRKLHPLLPRGITTINPGVIVGGSGGGRDGMPANLSGYSNFADYCALGLSLKYLPDERTEDVRREFEQQLARLAEADPWLREHPPEVEWGIGGVSFPPAETAIEHPLSQAVARAHEALHGTPRWSGSVGVSDMAWLAAAGIPCVCHGPGETTFAHGSQEHVRVEDLLAATATIALAIVGWCGVA